MQTANLAVGYVSSRHAIPPPYAPDKVILLVLAISFRFGTAGNGRPPQDPFYRRLPPLPPQTRTDFIVDEISETGTDKVACAGLGDLVRGFIAAPGHDSGQPASASLKSVRVWVGIRGGDPLMPEIALAIVAM